MTQFIAKRLSVRHIIVRARWALLGLSLRLCMSVCNGFTTEVYEFTYSLRTLRHVPFGMHFVHTSWSTEVTCRNELCQNFDINKELFVIHHATVDLTVQCNGRPKLLVGQMVKGKG